MVADANGDATKLVEEAQGYHDQTVQQAQGEADRFTALDTQYRLAPALTRERLYLETMQQVLAHSGKVIVDLPKGAGAPIILPGSMTPPAQPQHSEVGPAPAPAQTAAGAK